jgi:hypothetical protein
MLTTFSSSSSSQIIFSINFFTWLLIPTPQIICEEYTLQFAYVSPPRPLHVPFNFTTYNLTFDIPFLFRFALNRFSKFQDRGRPLPLRNRRLQLGVLQMNYAWMTYWLRVMACLYVREGILDKIMKYLHDTLSQILSSYWPPSSFYKNADTTPEL